MESLLLNFCKCANGTVNMPGSKSLSNRALLLAALASGKTRLKNLLDSDDVRHMLGALKALGVEYELSADRTICEISGLGGAFKTAAETQLFLGNAGTAMRPLAAALAFSEGTFVMTGEPRMYERPIKHLVDALRQAGAKIEYLKSDGFPPLNIVGAAASSGTLKIDGSVSSQYLTAALMAAPLMGRDVRIEIIGELVSKPYIDITLSLMKKFGVSVVNDNYQNFFIKVGQSYVSPGEFLVEGDASGASYFLAAGALAGDITVTGIGKSSVQGDIAFADALVELGADIEIADDYVRAKKSHLVAKAIDCNAIPDAAMTLCPLALFSSGLMRIENVGNWRVKETDRLAAMSTELKKFGAKVTEGEDFIEIEAPKSLPSGICVDTYNDHRMAMCFSLVRFAADVVINDPKCVGKTFPDYFERFASVCRE